MTGRALMAELWGVWGLDNGGYWVPPIDDPGVVGPEIMAFTSRADCELACEHQRQEHDVKCEPRRIVTKEETR